MQLSRIDLNLFTVFDAIYREGGITPASKRLHLSQPAISHALARLREILGDPLFERQGNAMVPTPVARSLAVTIGNSLRNIEQTLHKAGHFDPAASLRRFTIAIRDSHERSFLPDLIATIGREAPGIDIAAVRIDRRELEEDLQSGELDLAVDVALSMSPDIRRQRLGAEPLVVLARPDHPDITESLDLDTYLALGHVLVTGRRHGGGFEDIALGQRGFTRRIRARCQQYATAAAIVSQSDLLATMPGAQAQQVSNSAKIRLLPFPADVSPMELFLYWHANVDTDSANRWFREGVATRLAKNFGVE
jgi:DNA-binding transcriptional LysR family regulator